MKPASRLVALWRNIVHRERGERDLDDEVHSTVDALTDEKMRAGVPPDAARRAALMEIGGVEPLKEQIRAARSGAVLDTLAQDLSYAVRLIQRYPLFALTATLSLAVGIGANTAVFTLANGLLRFSPVAVAEPDRLVDIGRSLDGLPFGLGTASYPDYLDIRRRTKTLEHVYARMLFPRTMNLTASAGVGRAVAEVVTTNYFATLRTRAVVGRLFDPDESDQPGASPVVVLSHRFWTRWFNADPGIVGQTVRLNRQPVTVVGVAAEGFQGTTVVAADLWVPFSVITLTTGARPESLDARQAGWLVMGARLKPGATLAQAAAELDGIDRALREEYPSEQGPRPLRVLAATPMADKMPLAVAALVLLSAVAWTVLVIACANVVGLLLSRASGRRREMALRLAIGAGRARLVRQLLTETLMLFALGAASGVVLARVMTSVLVSILPTLPIPMQMSLALDWRVVASTCGLSLVAALLSGLAPALHASRAQVSMVLKDESQGASARSRVRNAFVVAQVALSLVLVIVGGLFTRTLQRASSTDAGFDAVGVEVVPIDVGSSGYTEIAGLGLVRELVDRVRQLPGVESASIAYALPLATEGLGLGLSLPGSVAVPGQPSAETAGSGNIVEPGYFATMRVPLLAGRDFTEQDAPGAPPVAIVGEAAAERFWPGQSPVGQRLVMNASSSDPATLEVVGVARDLRYRSLDFGAVPFVYLPLRQHYSPDLTLVVRSQAGRSVAGDLRRLVATVAPGLPPLSIQPLDDAIAVGLLPQRIVAFVAGGLGFAGMLLAAIGVYGVTASAVSRRTREIAIRSALGAQRGAIVRLVLRQAISLTTIGSVIGLALGAIAGQVVSLLLVGVSPLDPLTLTTALVLCTAVALAACYVPVYRAMRIAASEALRSE